MSSQFNSSGVFHPRKIRRKRLAAIWHIHAKSIGSKLQAIWAFITLKPVIVVIGDKKTTNFTLAATTDFEKVMKVSLAASQAADVLFQSLVEATGVTSEDIEDMLDKYQENPSLRKRSAEMYERVMK